MIRKAQKLLLARHKALLWLPTNYHICTYTWVPRRLSCSPTATKLPAPLSACLRKMFGRPAHNLLTHLKLSACSS